MSRRDTENTAFICEHCGTDVPPLTDGSFRNHCFNCLWSLHVDVRPGDRAAHCRAPMAPIGLRDRPKKGGWQIVHRCTACGAERANRAARSGERPDDVEALTRLLAAPPVRLRRSRS